MCLFNEKYHCLSRYELELMREKTGKRYHSGALSALVEDSLSDDTIQQMCLKLLTCIIVHTVNKEVFGGK